MVRIGLNDLKRVCASAPMFWHEIIRAGKVRSGSIELTEEQLNQYKPKVSGLGDIVAIVAQPIARAIRLGPCGGCKKRQDKLNKLFPLG